MQLAELARKKETEQEKVLAFHTSQVHVKEGIKAHEAPI